MFRLLFLALLLEASAALGPSLSKTLSKTGRPLVVHVWDKNPAELTEFAIDDVSEACRKAGASAVMVSPALVGAFSKEQEANRGNFPGPLPVIADVALKELDEELCLGAKNLGASALGLRYYSDDWPEEGALEETLKEAVAAAEQSGLDTILLPEFGADGDEGAEGAGELASRVGAAAGLTKDAEDKGGIALGCWDGSSEDLGRLREAGHKGLVLKNACYGDVAWGSKTKQPSLAAQAVTKLVKAALSKGSNTIWGGAGSTSGGNQGETLDSYFNRDNQPSGRYDGRKI